MTIHDGMDFIFTHVCGIKLSGIVLRAKPQTLRIQLLVLFLVAPPSYTVKGFNDLTIAGFKSQSLLSGGCGR